MITRLPTVLCLFFLPFAMIGCGKDCQSTCDKLFGDLPDQCGTKFSDKYPKGLLGSESRGEKMSGCMEACEGALKVPGELGDYDPYTKVDNSKEAPELENDRQTALWMECVAETDCSNIAEGFCAPRNF